MDGWYGVKWRAQPQHGAVMHLGLTEGARALPSLLDLARDPARPAVVRATAATVAQPYMRASFLPLARALLRESLARDIDRTLEEAFSFDGARCDRIVARVLARIKSGT